METERSMSVDTPFSGKMKDNLRPEHAFTADQRI